MRYKIGSSYDFFLVGPMIYACVMLIKKIPGVISGCQKRQEDILLCLVDS